MLALLRLVFAQPQCAGRCGMVRYRSQKAAYGYTSAYQRLPVPNGVVGGAVVVPEFMRVWLAAATLPGLSLAIGE